ncbi:tail tubular protein A [Synechococcus phage S-CBP42]|uniref:Tail tubular protein A n=1 Tax=Synechococcus phage S-CBP42 TaxID=461711 RepID=G8EYE1_9CAUD|nr:tail protein [Synechococcus phage S-CBP42]AET72521.1 tail tubular protein A [Synechococcus phage S-CBP42]AGK86659.1 tail tubular protein A [Synechococcus phage S-CBP42]
MATKQTKLDAVNVVLSNIGQAPVASIDTSNPMVAMASNLIDEVSESLQAEGWSFNTERDYPFVPNTDKHILIPANVLSFDTNDFNVTEVVVRDGKLYDKRAHSFVFNNTVNLDVVWFFDFEDLPVAFRNYIAMRAANLFAGRAVGSAEQVKFGEREEAQARAALVEYETQQGDFNMLSTSDNRLYRSYRPFDASYRI